MNDFFIKRHSKISQNTVWPVFSRVSIPLGTHVCTMWRCWLVAAVGVVPASRVAMDTSSLLIAFGLLLTFKAPATKLIISDEFKINEEVHAKLLHDYQVVGWKYSACSFKNKIFNWNFWVNFTCFCCCCCCCCFLYSFLTQPPIDLW